MFFSQVSVKYTMKLKLLICQLFFTNRGSMLLSNAERLASCLWVSRERLWPQGSLRGKNVPLTQITSNSSPVKCKNPPRHQQKCFIILYQILPRLSFCYTDLHANVHFLEIKFVQKSRKILATVCVFPPHKALNSFKCATAFVQLS